MLIFKAGRLQIRQNWELGRLRVKIGADVAADLFAAAAEGYRRQKESKKGVIHDLLFLPFLRPAEADVEAKT